MERPAEIDVAPLLLPNKVEIGGGRGGGCGDDGESDVGCEPRRTFSEDGSWREGRRSLSRLSGQEVFEHMGLGRFISIDEGRPRSQQILHDRRKSVNLLCLTILIFYSVSGGPFGIEGAVSAAGPFLTLLGLIILPFVWAIPEAMVTAELSAAFPDPSGFVGWVAAAFGTYWGFMEGYWSWLSGVADNSLYAVLLLDYFLQLVGEDGRGSSLASGLPRVCFLLLTCAILTCLNLLGLRIVGNVALTICIFSLLPFAIMVAWGGSGYSHPENWFNLPEGGWGAVKWGTFLNIIFWNTNYWDSAASFAGEVEDPGRSFPLAMAMCVVLVIFSNVLPVLVGTGVEKNPDYSQWEDGYFAVAAQKIAGPWLGVWVVAAAAVSNVGLFEAEMSSDALQIMGMAERGMLPLALAKRSSSRYGGAPIPATLLSATGILFLSFLDFNQLVEILNCLYAVAQLLEFAAFLQLRRTMPDFVRPWKIPLGVVGCSIMLTPAAAFLAVLIAFSSKLTWLVCALLIAAGFILHPLLEIARKRKWCEFAPLSFDFASEDFHGGGGNHADDEDDKRLEQENLIS